MKIDPGMERNKLIIDVMGWSGFILVVSGCALITPPAGLIAGGIILILVSILGGLRL